MRSNILAHLRVAFCQIIAHPSLVVDGDIGGLFSNGAQVLQIQNWFQESQAGRQCKGRQPGNFDFLQLTLNVHCNDEFKINRLVILRLESTTPHCLMDSRRVHSGPELFLTTIGMTDEFR